MFCACWLIPDLRHWAELGEGVHTTTNSKIRAGRLGALVRSRCLLAHSGADSYVGRFGSFIVVAHTFGVAHPPGPYGLAHGLHGCRGDDGMACQSASAICAVATVWLLH